jgi:hypothetical protein
MNVESWRENSVRSDVLTRKKVGSSRYTHRQPFRAGRTDNTLKPLSSRLRWTAVADSPVITFSSSVPRGE